MTIFVLFYVFFLFLISLKYLLRIKDVINPLVLFLTPLLVQYLIYYSIYRKEFSLSTKTLLVYILGMTSFVVGFFIFEKMNKKFPINKEYIIVENKTNWIFVNLCLVVGVVCLILTRIYLTKLNVSDFDLGSESANLREAFVYSLNNVPFYVKYGKYFLLFSTTIYFYEYLNGNHNINKLFMFSLLAILIINAFSVISRTDLLITIMPLLMIWIDCNKNKINKKFMKSIVFVFISIAIFFVLMNKMRTITPSNGLFDKNSSTMQYLGKPIIAFEQWILPHSNKSREILFLEPINKILLKFRLISPDTIELSPLGQFNVYSYLKVPYLQFGIVGVILLMNLVGYLVNYLYFKARTGSRNWLIFYSFYTYAIVMSFFDWQFGIMTYAYLILFLIGVSFKDTKNYDIRIMKKLKND